MVAEGVKIVNVAVPELVRDSVVGKGYRQGDSGSLPDVDIDFQSDRRQEVKEYLERRYNHNGLQRVFSAGTFTTLKLKAVLKDVARVYGVPVSEVNYINAIIEDDSLDWCGFFQLVHSKRRLKEFVQRYPQVIESIRTLMGQPRSSSVHASAIIITPDHKDGKTMECFDYLPIKKVDGMLVSEIDGYSIDEIGLLKNDCLGIKELERIQNTRSLVVQNYHDETTFLEIINDKLNDEKAYDLFVKGYTQNIFQFSSVGMTKFVMLMKPNNIDDLIVANALFRPATIEIGATDQYVKYKNNELAPEYLWGTYNSLKSSLSVLCYQEQMASIAREVGGFSLADGVHLVKYISKKKVDKIRAMKDQFMSGAKEKGCPDDQAKAIWAMFEAGGSYLFNKCISGKEHLMNIRKEPSFLSIEQMYKLRHNIPCDVPDMYKHFNAMFDVLGHYGVTISMNKDYRCYCNTIQDIQYSGHRELFRITLENGSTIDVTSNHKHPTQDGIKHTDELQAGVDSMYVVEDSSDRRNYGFVLCKIVSIESIGMEDVYDVTMADPYHNFVTGNGIVTCNSHATAYALTAYIGAWYKANYPTAFYTVALKYAKDENISTLMYEMDKASNCRVVPPDINKSGEEFITNFQTNEIYWSLTRIKFVGVETVRLIIEEREKRGPFRSFANFCDRIKTAKIEKSESEEGGRFPFTSRHIKNLIFAGCFDRIEYIENICQRYRLLQTAIRYFEFELDEELFAPHKINLEYFWSSLQIQACGIGSIDYRKAFDESIYKPSYKGKTYRNIEDCRDLALDGKRTVVCATIADMVEKTYTDKSTMDKKSFLKLTLQQNNDTIEMTVWQEDLDKYRDLFVNCVGRIIIVYAIIKFSDFSNANTLQVFKSSIINML